MYVSNPPYYLYDALLKGRWNLVKGTQSLCHALRR